MTTSTKTNTQATTAMNASQNQQVLFQKASPIKTTLLATPAKTNTQDALARPALLATSAAQTATTG